MLNKRTQELKLRLAQCYAVKNMLSNSELPREYQSDCSWDLIFDLKISDPATQAACKTSRSALMFSSDLECTTDHMAAVFLTLMWYQCSPRKAPRLLNNGQIEICLFLLTVVRKWRWFNGLVFISMYICFSFKASWPA